MRGWLRGHEVEWDEGAALWRYVDTHAPASGPAAEPRPCPQCQELPTIEGHDYCVQHIPGATGACCGHGVGPGYVSWNGIGAPRGWAFGAYVGGMD